MGAARPIPRARIAEHAQASAGRAGEAGGPATLRTALGAFGLLGVLATALLLAAGAAGSRSQYVPAREGVRGWPDWLAGPLAGLHLGLPGERFQTLILIMCGSYVVVLVCARTLPARTLWGTIVLAHVVLALGPPLLSQDVFGYLAFARMGALHGLDPYTHFPADAAGDPVFAFLGWPFQHSPYGPLFTLLSYAIAPLGLTAGVWVLKGLAAAASIAAIALLARAARSLGHSGRWAAAFVGLNPVVLVLAVGGAHNDTLIMLALAGALALSAGASPRPRAAAAALAAGVGVKVSAGLLLPFLVLGAPRTRERLRVLASAGLGLLAVAVVGLVGFGAHALGFLNAVGEQQQLVASHSIPAETARLVGLAGTPAWWRHLYAAAFVVVLVLALWRTARGADWRVAAGWSTLALLLSTAWLLPWYAVWLLPLAAVSGDRRLRVATLLVCAYAVLIHLPLADPVLSPTQHRVHYRLPFPVPGARHRLELTGFQVLGDVRVDLRW